MAVFKIPPPDRILPKITPRIESEHFQIRSANGQYRLLVTANGNVVIYNGTQNVPSAIIWQTNTANVGDYPHRFEMQSDGNLCLRDYNGTLTWQSGSAYRSVQPYCAWLDDTGVLRILESNQVEVWNNLGTVNWPFPPTNYSNSVPQASSAVSPSVYSQSSVITQSSALTQAQPQYHEFRFHQGDTIQTQEKIYTNKAVKSSNGLTQLGLHPDGNLVIHENGRTVWTSDSANKGKSPHYLIMQSDGNLVLYDCEDHPTWASATHGQGVGPFQARVNNDGTVEVLDSRKQRLWISQKKW
eukprot:gene9168-11236_t